MFLSIKSKYRGKYNFRLFGKSGAGITLVEIIVVIFLITIFSLIVVLSLQKIQQSMSISRAAHKLAQDLRRAQDLALSGAEVVDGSGNKITIAGYGIYINRSTIDARCKTNILIYADSCLTPVSSCSDPNGLGCCDSDGGDIYKYTKSSCGPACPGGDFIVSCIDINSEKKGVFIKGFNNINGSFTSINFTPPNPATAIQNLISGNSIDIVLGLESDSSQTRTVSVNTSGLIEVK